MESTPLQVAKFTTYLGALVKGIDGMEMDRKTLKVKTPISKDILGQYEAVLTYMCYHSRLVYEPKVRKILRMFDYLHYSPLVFNKILSMITYARGEKVEARTLTVAPTQPANGFVMYNLANDLPVYAAVFDYTAPGASKLFPGEKIMVVSFRGTLSAKTLMKDLIVIPEQLNAIWGEELFSEYAGDFATARNERLAKGTHPFGAHRGFVDGIKAVYQDLLAKMKSLVQTNPGISKIFITGHSLGAAYSNLFSLGLAQEKKKNGAFSGQSLHCINFGGPMSFTKLARDIFNGFLVDGTLTLDRVINSPRFYDVTGFTFDFITKIPPTLKHPGFRIEPTEIKTQSRTGRTRHIRELRSELAHLDRKQAWYSLDKAASKNYNALPYYEEFFNKWKDSEVDSTFTAADYKSLLNTTLHGTVRLSTGAAGKVIGICKKLTGLQDAEIKEGEKTAASVESMGEKVLRQEPTPPEVAAAQKEEQSVKGGINAAYGGVAPPEEPQQGGALAKWDELNPKYNPNTVVYSCSLLTGQAGLPWLTCHLGYMGISWVGLWMQISAGTQVFKATRDFQKEAQFFVDATTKKWSYLSDTTQEIPVVSRGGKRRGTQKKQRKLKRKQTRRSN
jgi:hypothetical protein